MPHDGQTSPPPHVQRYGPERLGSVRTWPRKSRNGAGRHRGKQDNHSREMGGGPGVNARSRQWPASPAWVRTSRPPRAGSDIESNRLSRERSTPWRPACASIPNVLSAPDAVPSGQAPRKPKPSASMTIARRSREGRGTRRRRALGSFARHAISACRKAKAAALDRNHAIETAA